MKKALVVISFGTSVHGAEGSIENIENILKNSCPDRIFLRAFTSRIICRKLAREGRPVLSPEEAFEKLAAEGAEDVIVMPTHFTPGDEYDKLVRIAEEYRGDFQRFVIGKPLIAGFDDLVRTAQCVREHFADILTGAGQAAGDAAGDAAEDTAGDSVGKTALLLMGHGSEHIAAMIYGALQTAFRILSEDDIFVGTVEGWPGLSECVAQLKNKKYSTVHLSPFMLVAGDHALNDMAGDGPDSWKNVLASEGFKVVCHLEGMGSWENIGQMYEKHLREAMLPE